MVMSVTLETGTKMLYIDEDMVKKNLSCRGYGLDAALCGLDRSDLTTHVYEGGFKLWESSLDLCDLIEKEIEKIKDKRIIELDKHVPSKRWVAAKLFYFGVGGNIPDFISYINAQGVFTITSKMMVDSNIPRQILELRRK
uniref:Nicotinate phosphoribosyltransferase n=1 Tax=Heterorhabditis bacteriophora TaxID=37862 RepID=A0A1I7XJC9_HETBA